MTYVADTIKLKYGITVEIVHDQDAKSPADWDNVSEIAWKYSEYRGRNHCPFGPNMAVNEERFAELAEEAKNGVIVAVAVDVRDHGSNGIHLACHNDFDECDAIFYCSKKKALYEFGKDTDKLASALAEALTEECRAKAIACMKSEAETWQQYFSGDVYGVVVKDKGGKTLESCWGFYGFDYAKQEAESMGKAEVRAEEKKRREAREQAKREAVERSYWAARGMVTA